VLYHALESPQLRPEVIQLLLVAGTRIDYTPLIWAIKNINSEVPEVVAMLIKAGANVNERDEVGTTALIVAVNFRRNQIVDLLLRSRAEINAVGKLMGRTALAWAVANQDTETVKQLIKAGSDLEMIDKQGNTPLMIAKNNGFEEIANLLKDAGATQ
jgi:ankyrin repeat protein